MARYAGQKLKIPYLLKIFLQDTDSNHGLTMKEIIGKLKIYGIDAERKALYDDIADLRDIFGLDIQIKRGKTTTYFLASNILELSQLKMLVDCVQASKFITEGDSNKIIKKLESLTSIYEARELQRQVYIAKRPKSENDTLLDNVDTIHKAIMDNKQISFKYFNYKADKSRHIRNNGKDYLVSPYSLNISEDNYYLICHYDKHEGFTHFRVDRMIDVRLTDYKRLNISEVAGKQFDLGEYSKKVFSMYRGEKEYVSLLCRNSVANAVIDRFGKDVNMYPEDENNFKVNVNVEISPTFFAWLFTFGCDIKIISPQKAILEMKKRTKEVEKLYK
ncbi:MAG: WYL domain-containing protein [Clostridia bacterium]|nr:WYL domain-containing protein [Clostridia bacterium]